MASDESGDGDVRDDRVDRHRTCHDWEGDGSVSTSVVQGVAAVTGDAPTEIEPLYEAVDPDALDRLVASLRGDGGGEVRFVLDGCEVTVEADGAIEFRHPE